jgi:SNF2 family DNA or RNA helicase
LNLKLEPYQQEAVDFLYTRDRAALFASMGLGKSAATLCALNQLFQDGAIRAALIVAPLRVAKLTWPNEIAK